MATLKERRLADKKRRQRWWQRQKEQGNKAFTIMLTPEMQKTTARDTYWSHHVAGMYGKLGEYEEALRWIEQAVDVGFINYPMLAEHDPFLTKMRGQPEYEALLERVKREWESFEV